MGRGPYWPDTRTPKLIAPTLDAVSGRSYGQSSQTQGALGGRRAVLRWFHSGVVPNSSSNIGLTAKVVGGAWRVIAASARVVVAPNNDSMVVRISMIAPDESRTKIFLAPTTSWLQWGTGDLEASGEGIIPGFIIPIGYRVEAVIIGSTGGVAEDLTVELHYRVRAVTQ